jgi:hypothetical protein
MDGSCHIFVNVMHCTPGRKPKQFKLQKVIGATFGHSLDNNVFIKVLNYFRQTRAPRRMQKTPNRLEKKTYSAAPFGKY